MGLQSSILSSMVIILIVLIVYKRFKSKTAFTAFSQNRTIQLLSTCETFGTSLAISDDALRFMLGSKSSGSPDMKSSILQLESTDGGRKFVALVAALVDTEDLQLYGTTTLCSVLEEFTGDGCTTPSPSFLKGIFDDVKKRYPQTGFATVIIAQWRERLQQPQQATRYPPYLTNEALHSFMQAVEKKDGCSVSMATAVIPWSLAYIQLVTGSSPTVVRNGTSVFTSDSAILVKVETLDDNADARMSIVQDPRKGKATACTLICEGPGAGSRSDQRVQYFC